MKLGITLEQFEALSTKEALQHLNFLTGLATAELFIEQQQASGTVVGIVTDLGQIERSLTDSKALPLDKRAAIGSELHGRLKIVQANLSRSTEGTAEQREQLTAQATDIKHRIWGDLLGLDLNTL